jgi:hypothetical protein
MKKETVGFIILLQRIEDESKELRKSRKDKERYKDKDKGKK